MNHPLSSAVPRVVAAVAAVAATGVLAAGCGSSTSSSTTSKAAPAAAATATSSSSAPAVSAHKVDVSISGYAFHPATITVATGARVTFTNHDQTAHTATSTKPGFDTGTVKPGKSATVLLKRPGTYTFCCQFHAFMRGTIVVK
jgi:plastocyanin